MSQVAEPKLCGCGCGKPTAMIPESNRKRGYVKGEFYNYVKNHSPSKGQNKPPETIARMKAAWKDKPRPWLRGKRNPSTWKVNPSSGTLHTFIKRHHPKTGSCERCGKKGKTDYAFLRHPLPYTRDRADYAEMCRSCHVKFDYDNGHRRRMKKS